MYRYMLDTKGPEVRTAMLRGGTNIELVAGQEVTLVAVGDEYDKWEGYKDESTGAGTHACMQACQCSPQHLGAL